jgi:cell wall-associated NlpC family hydrolase
MFEQLDFTRFIGIPYVDKGTDPKTGIDCWQLVKYFYSEVLGKDIPDYMAFYQSSMDKQEVLAAMSVGFSEWKRVDEPEFGDVLVFRITDSPWHTGVYLYDDLMLHTIQGHNSAIERYTSIRWRHRLYGIYRWQN